MENEAKKSLSLSLVSVEREEEVSSSGRIILLKLVGASSYSTVNLAPSRADSNDMEKPSKYFYLFR